jgi:hypothetical protein
MIHMNTKWLRPGDFFILGAVILLAGIIILAFFFPSQSKATYCVIQQDGVIIEKVELGKQIHRTIEIDGDYHNTIEIDDDRVRFAFSDCPNHFCEQTGWISKSYQSAVCLPNNVIIQIVSEEDTSLDVIT